MIQGVICIVTFVTGVVVFACGVVAFANGVVVLFACGVVVFVYRQWCSRWYSGVRIWVVAFAYGAVAFANGATAGCVTVSLGRIGKGSSTGQDPGTTNDSARLHAHMSLMSVSNGAGLGTSPLIERKNASCRDSTVSVDETVLTSTGSITARRSVSPIVAPIPTEVITSASSRNLFVESTGKE